VRDPAHALTPFLPPPLRALPQCAFTRPPSLPPPSPKTRPTPGGDASQGFNDTGHSSSAKKDLAALQVGVLNAADKAEMARLAKEAADKASASMGMVGFVVAGVVAAAALAYQFLGQKSQAQ
jgi:hypothetical protein